MNSPLFVAIGEAMVELRQGPAEGTFHRGFAGDTFNTAWYCARLLGRGTTRYVTAIGQDLLSSAFLDFASEAGIDTGGILRLPDATMGLYMIHLDRGERSFSYWRSVSAARHLAANTRTLSGAIEGAKIVFLSGITAAIMIDDGARENLAICLREARARGQTIVFDPNLRPALWTSPEILRYHISAFAGLADIALPSFEDEAAAFGDASPEATASRYHDAGARIVVVKNGGGPVTLSTPDGIAVLPTEAETRPVDTTGAGDSFNAGFLTGYLKGLPFENAVKEGARVASCVIGGHGALIDL